MKGRAAGVGDLDGDDVGDGGNVHGDGQARDDTLDGGGGGTDNMGVFPCCYDFLENRGQVLGQKVGKGGLVGDDDTVDAGSLGNLGCNRGTVRASNKHVNTSELLSSSNGAEGGGVKGFVVVVCDDERRPEALEKRWIQSGQVLPA